MKISRIKNKNIAILGFGKEGRSTLDFLLKLGINNITILDLNYLSIQNIETSGKKIKIVSGEKYLDNLSRFDIIFKSPGISPYNQKLLKYKSKLLSQAEVFFSNYEGRIIGISGTKGKSTTSTLIYKTLKSYGYNVRLVGNIGNPVLSEIDILGTNTYDYIIYELSSYMLESFTPKCFISILLNIYPDHLDWHENYINYRQAKLNILKESINSLIHTSLKEENNQYKIFGNSGDYFYKGHNFYINNEKIFQDKKIQLKGDHNKSNISAVLGILDTIGIKDFARFESLLENFVGLPHRLENIGTFSGITFIDDAISTTPESTIEAIKTYGDKIGTIFLGGTDRGYDFVNLVKYLKEYSIKNIVLFPNSGKKIKNYLTNSFNILETSSMKKAIDFAYKNTLFGDICILSTASPSYSLWKNFEEKGDEFKKEILLQNTSK